MSNATSYATKETAQHLVAYSVINSAKGVKLCLTNYSMCE